MKIFLGTLIAIAGIFLGLSPEYQWVQDYKSNLIYFIIFGLIIIAVIEARSYHLKSKFDSQILGPKGEHMIQASIEDLKKEIKGLSSEILPGTSNEFREKAKNKADR